MSQPVTVTKPLMLFSVVFSVDADATEEQAKEARENITMILNSVCDRIAATAPVRLQSKTNINT